jgi:hypothetical protein
MLLQSPQPHHLLLLQMTPLLLLPALASLLTTVGRL